MAEVAGDELEVVSWAETEAGTLAGRLRWSRTPDVEFDLELSRDGRLLSWRSRATGDGSLTWRQIRDAPVGAMERALRAEGAELQPTARRVYLSPRLEAVGADDLRARIADEHELERWRAMAADFALRPRTGAKGRSDRSYAAVAACYVAAFERGEPHPARAVAEELGSRETTVRNYLTKARDRGLLNPAMPGRAGGSLTEKARRLLDDAEPAG